MHASLCELLDCLVNARQPILQLCHRGGVGNTHIAVIPKGIPRHDSDPGCLQQIVSYFCRSGQKLPLRPPPEQTSDVRKDVERATRGVTRDTMDGVETLHDKIAALLKGLCHGPNALLRSGQGFDPGYLGKGRGVTGSLALQAITHLDHLPRPSTVAEPPASHGIGLREPIDDYRTRFQGWIQCGNADLLQIIVNDMLVNLISNDKEI